METDPYRELSILVVDDVKVHGFLMESGIRSINPGAKVEQATGVEDAIAKLENGSFHVVVSDWNMPDGGGAAIIKWMRARAHYRRVPFVMISDANDNSDIISAFMELGVDAYVVKPFDKRDLYDKVVAAWTKRQSAS